MKTIPVEQASAYPWLFILELVVALAIFITGIYVIHKKLNHDKKKTLWASTFVGLFAGAVMVGIFVGVSANVAHINDDKLHAVVTKSGEKLSEGQITELKTNGIVAVDNNKTVVYSDEGNGYNLTIYDAANNAKAQSDAEKAAAKKLANNDY